MITQRTEILKQLPLNGWQVLSVEDSSLEWWADEIWLIESLWSPKGISLYLTFLVDPMADSRRAKGHEVWAVGTSIERLHDRVSAEGEPLLSLGHGWRSRLDEFFVGLAGLRNHEVKAVSE